MPLTGIFWQQCDRGHIWESTPGNVKAGSWCTVYRKAGRQARWLAEMQAMAQARGGRCLSGAYVTSATKLRWQCGEGHMSITIRNCDGAVGVGMSGQRHRRLSAVGTGSRNVGGSRRKYQAGSLPDTVSGDGKN